MKGHSDIKVLIIGGTGVLSKTTCDMAISRNYQVTTLNRGTHSKRQNKSAKLIICDIHAENINQIRDKIGNVKFDIVIDFLSYNKDELQKTLEILRGRCKQFIFISTATVYKKNEKEIYLETDAIGNSLWDYAYKKSECEWLLEKSYQEYVRYYTIIRPYVTFDKTRIPYQICPKEYYTIINRIKLNKPIPIFNPDSKCTLTSADDFCQGLMGIFCNNNAFNEVIQIVGDCRTTWKNIITYIGKLLDKTVVLVELDDNVLKESTNMGINFDEIVGDKGRNMVFDNSKIKNIVPEFKTNSEINHKIRESIEYYEKNCHAQTINYLWDGCIDRVISKSLKYNSISDFKDLKENIRLIGKTSVINRAKYYIGRYAVLYLIMKKLILLFK